MTEKKDYFAEKVHQVTPSKLEAFGIKIESRYGNVNELIQLFNFAKFLYQYDLGQYIEDIFYDSQTGLAFINLKQGITEDDERLDKLTSILKTNVISEVEWRGNIYPLEHEPIETYKDYVASPIWDLLMIRAMERTVKESIGKYYSIE